MEPKSNWWDKKQLKESYLAVFFEEFCSFAKASLISSVQSTFVIHVRNFFRVIFFIEKRPSPVHPSILIGSAELNRKFTDVMFQFFYVSWNFTRMQNSGWPPTVMTQFDPGHLSGKNKE